MSAEDPFAVLGLAPTASADDIRAAYRGLLKKHKPERDPDGFRRIREAFERANDLASRRRWQAQAPVADVAEPVEASSAEGLRIPTGSLDLPPEPEPAGEPALARGFPAFPDAPATTPDSHASGARFDLPVDEDARFAAFDALEQAYWAMSEDDPIARARFVLGALGTVDDDLIADLLFGAFDAIAEPSVRSSLLTPYAEDARLVIKALILTHAPSLLSFEQLAVLEHELEDRDLLGLMVEWARRGHPHSATKLADSLAAKAGNGLPPTMILEPLASLGLELLAAGRADDALRVRDRMREVDLARPPGQTTWHSLALMQFRALLAKRTSIGDTGVSYLAHAALGTGDVRAAKSPPTLELVKSNALTNDPVLAPLVPRVVRDLGMPARVDQPLTKGRGVSAFTMIFVSISLIRLIAAADCGHRPSSQEILRDVQAEQARLLAVPISADAFGPSIELAAVGRACVDGFEGCGDGSPGPADSPHTGTGECITVRASRCTLAGRAAAAVAAGECTNAEALLGMDLNEYVVGPPDVWSERLQGYVATHCSDGGTAP